MFVLEKLITLILSSLYVLNCCPYANRLCWHLMFLIYVQVGLNPNIPSIMSYKLANKKVNKNVLT